MPTKPSNSGKRLPKPHARMPTGRLILTGLRAYGYHGNNPAERELGQTFTADLEVTLDTQRGAASDNIHDTVSYPVIEKIAREILEGKPANLLETVAERIAAGVLRLPNVIQVTVRVSKHPPLANLGGFAVEITRPVEMPKQPQ
ncbi:MAG TPA: dihydroneopterin aldolase [Candidatus Acidoferrum sp.]|nr:dihydroneopterin aldolase [Candidatus Acidoferrum sp.]